MGSHMGLTFFCQKFPGVLFSEIFKHFPMGYLGDGRLGLNFGIIWRIDPKYFGRCEIDFGQGAKK